MSVGQSVSSAEKTAGKEEGRLRTPSYCFLFLITGEMGAAASSLVSSMAGWEPERTFSLYIAFITATE